MIFSEVLKQNTYYYCPEKDMYIKSGTVWDNCFEIAYLGLTGYYASNYWTEKRRKITNLEKIMLAIKN